MVSVPRPRASVVSFPGPDVVLFEAAAWRSGVRLRALARRPHEPQRSPSLRRWAWLLAIAIHVLVAIGLRFALRQGDVAAVDAGILQVELIDASSAPPLPEPAATPSRVPAAARRALAPSTAPIVTQRAAPATPGRSATPEASPPAVDALRLFNADGSASVPDDLAAQIDRDRPKPDFIARDYAPSPVLQARRPLKVRPNHFAKYWSGSDGKPLHEQFFDSVTVVREFTAPWGGRYGCAWVLIIVACADVPDKPWIPPTTWKPATEQDEY